MSDHYHKVLRKSDQQVIQLLSGKLPDCFYLAGGTGLALQIGHRLSYDFDFFSPDPFNNDRLKHLFNRIGTFQLFQDSRGTLEGVIDETRLTFLHYAYPLLNDTIPMHGIKLASVTDISLMKLSAISSRGSKKDFIDLFFLKDSYSFDELMDVFQKKYKDSGYNLLHIIKSLAYFDDAEEEPMPNMLIQVDWEQVKQYFLALEKHYIKTYIR